MAAETLTHFGASAQPFGRPVFREGPRFEGPVDIAEPGKVAVVACLATETHLDGRPKLDRSRIENGNAGAVARAAELRRRTGTANAENRKRPEPEAIGAFITRNHARFGAERYGPFGGRRRREILRRRGNPGLHNIGGECCRRQ